MKASWAFAVLIVQSLASTSAGASCAGNADQLVKDNDEIFVGIAMEQMSFPTMNYDFRTTWVRVGVPSEELSSLQNPENRYDQLTTFRVVETLKGYKQDKISIWTCHGCSEGLSFRIGEQALVGASMSEGKLKSSGCSLGTNSPDDIRAAIQKAGVTR